MNVTILGNGNGGNGQGVELDEVAINNLLINSDEYFGWSLHSFNNNEVMLFKEDSGSGGKSFLPLKKTEIQRLYDQQKPVTMNVKG